MLDRRGETRGQSCAADTHSAWFILFAVLDLLIKQLCGQEMKERLKKTETWNKSYSTVGWVYRRHSGKLLRAHLRKDMLRGFLKMLETVSTFFKYSYLVCHHKSYSQELLLYRKVDKEMLADTDSIYKYRMRSHWNLQHLYLPHGVDFRRVLPLTDQSESVGRRQLQLASCQSLEH